jgi:hypothetical protein
MRLKKFDGSMYGFEGITPMLDEFITKMNMVVVPGQGENRNFRKLKIVSGIAAVIFAVWGGLTIRSEVLDYRLEKKFYAAASEKIQKFSYDIEADADGDKFIITGLVSTPAISEELNSIASGFLKSGEWTTGQWLLISGQRRNTMIIIWNLSRSSMTCSSFL